MSFLWPVHLIILPLSSSSPIIQSPDSSSPSSHVLGLKLKSLILDTIHSIDIVSSLIHGDVKSVGQWLWKKQLRHYLRNGMKEWAISKHFLSTICLPVYLFT